MWSNSGSPEIWKEGHPSINNATALAVTSDMRAYAIIGGQIQQYDITRDNPASWTLIGNITTT